MFGVTLPLVSQTCSRFQFLRINRKLGTRERLLEEFWSLKLTVGGTETPATTAEEDLLTENKTKQNKTRHISKLFFSYEKGEGEKKPPQHQNVAEYSQFS